MQNCDGGTRIVHSFAYFSNYDNSDVSCDIQIRNECKLQGSFSPDYYLSLISEAREQQL